MSTRAINTVLTLSDRMSRPLIAVSSRTRELSRQTRVASNAVRRMSKSYVGAMDKLIKRTALAGGAIAAIAGKIGFTEAFNLEGYRMQLETATKDTKKAADIMKYSIDLANRTPFEGGELVEGASKLEAMGLSAKNWLPKIGDMAAATNKPFDQAIEAVIDAQSGELERLKEFGITKAKITEKANEMYKGQQVVNNKGQIQDFEKFNNAMVAIMKDRFTGGMEKQSTTIKGMWSTVTGVTKSALANIIGMQNDGAIRAGSALEKIKNKVGELSEKLQKWQSSNSFRVLSVQVGLAFDKIYTTVSSVFKFISEHQELVKGVVGAFIGLYAAVKVVGALKAVIEAVKFSMLIFNAVMAMSPLGWFALAVGVAVAACVMFPDKVAAMGEKISEVFNSIKERVIENWNKIIEFFKHPIRATVEYFEKGSERIQEQHTKGQKWANGVEEANKTQNSSGKNKVKGGNALGTSYWQGGWTAINERGTELINLPSGSKVNTANETRNIMGGKGVSIGNIIINAKGVTADEVVNEIVPQLQLRLANM